MRRRVVTVLTLKRRGGGAMMLLHSVIAGLDPAIHLAWRLRDARIFNLRPNTPREKFRKSASKCITAVDNAMTPA
jgi:hypothetical protein